MIKVKYIGVIDFVVLTNTKWNNYRTILQFQKLNVRKDEVFVFCSMTSFQNGLTHFLNVGIGDEGTFFYSFKPAFISEED